MQPLLVETYFAVGKATPGRILSVSSHPHTNVVLQNCIFEVMI